jgi:Zn-dependent alcohol dehydrogenase
VKEVVFYESSGSWQFCVIQLAKTHDLKLDKLVTNKFRVEDINNVADTMHKRQLRGRWVCAWD